MKLFHTLSSSVIGGMIRMAKHRVIYAAPSLDDGIAAALIDRHKALSPACTVILDYSEDIFRLGYGIHGSINMLLESDVPVRKHTGLRIGCLIIDEQGWAFSLPPMAVESQHYLQSVNGIELMPDQLVALTESLGINAGSPSKPEIKASEIGKATLTADEVQSVTSKLEKNPPQAFDLQRQVRVYQSHLQFVEVELEGGRIEQRSIRLPKELKESIFANEKDVESRLSASYKLINANASKAFSALRDEANSLRDHYAPSLGKRLGRVLLLSRKQEFVNHIRDLQQRLDTYCKEALGNIQAEIERSLQDLANSLAPLVVKHPPSQLRARCSQVTEEIAKTFLLDILYKAAPSAKKLLDSTTLHVTYKDVTLEMLQDGEFQQKVANCFPYENWLKPFEDYQAAQAQQGELV